jgi:peptidoglycan biosynthesis protein MviN/MurJ (putative lipid II flippase)
VIALIVVIRAQLVRVVLGSGEFDWDDTRLTAAVLAIFSLSLFAQAIHLLVVRALYAAGNTRLPFYVTVISSIGILFLAGLGYVSFLMLEPFRAGLEAIMRVSEVPGTEVLVLPLAYSIGLILHVTVLLGLSQKYLHVSLREIYAHFLQALTAAFAAGSVAYIVLNLFADGIRTEKLAGIFLQGLLAGLAGIATAALAYHFEKSEELGEVKRALKQRIFKTKVAPPQDEDHLSV